MPSTRGSAQKRQADTRSRSVHDVLDDSPSRPPTKKKKLNAPAPRRPRRPKTPEPESDDESDFDDNNSSSEVEAQAIADKIIPLLDVAKWPVAVATKYQNSPTDEPGRTVQAFARLSGRHWTYYVHEPKVVIGRPFNPDPHHSSSVGAESSPGTIPHGDSDRVDIDLGPSKTISRSHAEIRYVADDSSWHVEVKGRNGLRVNDNDFRRGHDTVIGSGDVLEIAGTQMMFVTGQGRLNVHSKFLERLDMHAEDEESARQDVATHAHPEASYPAAPSSSSRLPPPPARITSSQPKNQAAKAAAAPEFHRPVTPVQSPKKPQQYSSALGNSPAYGHGFIVESTEHIDYASEAARELKPSISYAVMITQAILSTPSETITLNGIYEWIKRNFAYYRYLSTNWQNSIRHNLSLNASFAKIPRGPNEPGKGMKWHIVPEKRAEMIAGVAKHLKKTNVMRSSAPNSPSASANAHVPIRYAPQAPPQPYSSESNAESNGIVKTSSPGHSPPLAPYPIARESYTPSRGSRFTALSNHEHSHGLPQLSDDPSPLPIRRNNLKAGITDSSPVLTSGFMENSMMTPAPRKYNLNAPLPNTVKLPTSHMPDSSPAPFWKYGSGSLLGSTPAKWPELSPLKAGGTLQSSSPPPEAMNGNAIESPTRGRGGRPGTTEFSSQNVDDDEGEIDILRGFKGIGQYHQERSTATVGNTA
ncbi:MAG: hypothetical protein LQ348_002172 [Seirophora lacunosa]|nr:MAG: hypothetical protein LQ348_002172 [Seirophora lacunosa]